MAWNAKRLMQPGATFFATSHRPQPDATSFLSRRYRRQSRWTAMHWTTLHSYSHSIPRTPYTIPPYVLTTPELTIYWRNLAEFFGIVRKLLQEKVLDAKKEEPNHFSLSALLPLVPLSRSPALDLTDRPKFVD
jgi:hypothetical protein